MKEKDSRSEEEKRKQYMLQEEMRVRRVKEAELIRRRKAEVFKCAASLRAGSELANSVETAEELIEAQAEIERRKEAERKRDRDMRRDRKQRREEEMAHQHAYEAMKNEWNEKLVRLQQQSALSCCQKSHATFYLACLQAPRAREPQTRASHSTHA